MFFFGKMLKKTKKNPRCFKRPRTNPRPSGTTQEPKIGSKTQDLGRKSKERQRW